MPASGTEAPEGILIDQVVVSSADESGDGMQAPNRGEKPQQVVQAGRPDSHGAGAGESEAGSMGEGASAHPNAAYSVLSEIRARIERAKRYPEAARRMRLGGETLVKFSIDPQGGLAELKIVESSGSELLDTAALDTVRRAVPFPAYLQTIRVTLRFEP